MILQLKFIAQSRSGLARLYENRAGVRHWIPRSVCKSTMKYDEKNHEVDINDGWLERNPWPADKQNQLKL